ncbi:MAG TPA: hypothetical protein VGS00_11180 [Thermoanaerobaculia bacterium]|nr:hypothetical protein [Thermoanaerobaculia bacterium]
MPASVPPTIDDANLVLRLYDLRREEKLRAAREWYRTKFCPLSVEDIKTLYQTPGEENTSFRMATTYWDMACSFVASGVLHPELFMQSGSESLMVWSRVEEFVPHIRKEMGVPWFLASIEKVIAMTPSSQERLALFRSRLAAMREKIQKARKSA